MTVQCKDCGHQWDVIMPLPMPIDRAVTVMNGAVAAGCPVCRAHGKSVLVGPVGQRRGRIAEVPDDPFDPDTTVIRCK